MSTLWLAQQICSGRGKHDPWPTGVFFLFWLHCTACGILVPQPGIEPVSPAGETQSPNHWQSLGAYILIGEGGNRQERVFQIIRGERKTSKESRWVWEKMEEGRHWSWGIQVLLVEVTSWEKLTSFSSLRGSYCLLLNGAPLPVNCQLTVLWMNPAQGMLWNVEKSNRKGTPWSWGNTYNNIQQHEVPKYTARRGVWKTWITDPFNLSESQSFHQKNKRFVPDGLENYF